MDFFKNLFKKEVTTVNTSKNEYIFILDNLEVLYMDCDVNERVNLWGNPQMREVKVYKRGENPEMGRPYVMGEGLIGRINSNNITPIYDHLVKKGSYYAEIREKRKYNLVIYCKLFEESERHIEEERIRIRELLKKEYNPKTPARFKLANENGYPVTKSSQFVLKFKPFEEYVKNVDDLSIEVKSVDNTYSNAINDVNLIRAWKCGYNCIVEVGREIEAFSFSILVKFSRTI